MISNEKLSELLTWSGLFLLILLAFEVLSGESFSVYGNIMVDSTFIVALGDVAIVSFGLVIYSRKIKNDALAHKDSDEHKEMGTPFAEAGGIVITFLLSTLLLLLAFQTIPWNTVEWFDPPLNFQMIRTYMRSNLLISLLLILALIIVLAHNDFNRDTNPKKSE